MSGSWDSPYHSKIDCESDGVTNQKDKRLETPYPYFANFSLL